MDARTDDPESFVNWLDGRADEIESMTRALERPPDYAQGKIDAFRESAARQTLTGYGELIEVLESLPVILREARRRKGVSIRQAAIELDVSFSSISRWEAGITHPDTPKIIKVLRWSA